MLSLLAQVLILVIVIGALLYILSILPIDATIKNVGKVVILVIAAIYVINLLIPMLHAQPVRDDNGLEEFLRGLEGRQENPDLVCNVNRRINRNGEVVWLRLDCRRKTEFGDRER